MTSSSNQPVLVWFHRDLRLADHPALFHATQSQKPIIPIYIHVPEEETPWEMGDASKVWLAKSLESLSQSLEKIGSKLIIRKGPTLKSLTELQKETNACALYWNRRHEPTLMLRDIALKKEWSACDSEIFPPDLLFSPKFIKTQSGNPFQVFTPFWKACLAEPPPTPPVEAPKKIVAPSKFPKSLSISDLDLTPSLSWDQGFWEKWEPGEQAAQKQMNKFFGADVENYKASRDYPAQDGTSGLSPHLHFGEISPRQIWHTIHGDFAGARFKSHRDVNESGTQAYLRELGWREFACHLLHHFHQLPTQPLRENFKKFPWKKDSKALKAWQRGMTGYPIVDAGMRQLWKTGWMHNRVRMIVASFLVKHLLISWEEGARWFWDTLVDADLANNTLGWQWAAGCGPDAAPYFRIFNPVIQGEKFDPEGEYVKTWVPELKGLPASQVHQPWKNPPKNYAAPIVDHAFARKRALESFAKIKNT